MSQPRVISTDFIRSFMHCSLQATLCSRAGITTPASMLQSCVRHSIKDCIEQVDQPLHPERVRARFEQLWTHSHSDTQFFDLATALVVQDKYSKRLLHAVSVINDLLKQGFYLVGADFIIESPVREGWRLHHQIDLLMRREGSLLLGHIQMSRLIDISKSRVVSRSMLHLLNVFSAKMSIEEPCQTLLISATQPKSLPVTLDATTNQSLDMMLAHTQLDRIIQILEMECPPHAEICSLNCDYCPVHRICDNPILQSQLPAFTGIARLF